MQSFAPSILVERGLSTDRFTALSIASNLKLAEKLKPFGSIPTLYVHRRGNFVNPSRWKSNPRLFVFTKLAIGGKHKETIYEAVTMSALKQPLEERSWLLATGSKGHFLGGSSIDTAALATTDRRIALYASQCRDGYSRPLHRETKHVPLIRSFSFASNAFSCAAPLMPRIKMISPLFSVLPNGSYGLVKGISQMKARKGREREEISRKRLLA